MSIAQYSIYSINDAQLCIFLNTTNIWVIYRWSMWECWRYQNISYLIGNPTQYLGAHIWTLIITPCFCSRAGNDGVESPSSSYTKQAIGSLLLHSSNLAPCNYHDDWWKQTAHYQISLVDFCWCAVIHFYSHLSSRLHHASPHVLSKPIRNILKHLYMFGIYHGIWALKLYFKCIK